MRVALDSSTVTCPWTCVGSWVGASAQAVTRTADSNSVMRMTAPLSNERTDGQPRGFARNSLITFAQLLGNLPSVRTLRSRFPRTLESELVEPREQSIARNSEDTRGA